MTQRRHRMPFGSEVLDDGRVRFRLWAPAAKQVTLCLGEGDNRAELPMAAEADGWFGLTTDQARAGSLYRYRIDDNMEVPDPASRYQPQDVHGPSAVVDPAAFQWRDQDWRGRPWRETVLYEIHVGSFSPEGTYAGVQARLDQLQALGVTALELMPLSDFPGGRNWGYDGVYPFAPDSAYGSPEQLKELIQETHRRGMMIFLDVVYNHFGPEGNYLHSYAPQFFTHRHLTPWGDGINFDGEMSASVRQFFVHNALYWLEEYHFDGLRLDAVHAIVDDSQTHVLTAIAERVRADLGRDRHVHLVLENDDNAAHFLPARGQEYVLYDAQWNDDIHHVFHVLLTGEDRGYYADYAEWPITLLARCLSTGFAYQGEPSVFRDGAVRGEPSADRTLTAFVNFLQNHDQVGNRAFGERIHALAEPQPVRAATAVLLLAPAPPMLFMGQESGCEQPFPFFCDFGDDLAAAVTEGRRKEFERFPEFSDPAMRAKIPDPNAPATFDSAVLRHETGAEWVDFHRQLLQLRRNEIVPRIEHLEPPIANVLGDTTLRVTWPMRQGGQITLVANLGKEPAALPATSAGTLLYETPAGAAAELSKGTLPPWATVWSIEAAHH